MGALPELSPSGAKYLVSVAAVAYESDVFLPELLESVASQTVDLSDVQVVVTDDASGDKSDEVVARYSSRIPNLVYSRNAKNLGITGNSNRALSLCEGRFCIIIGGDDLLMPNRIETGLEWFANNPGGVLNSSGVEIFQHETGELLGVHRDIEFIEEWPIARIVSLYNQLPTSRFMFDRLAVPDLAYDSRTPVVSDWLFINEMLFYGPYGSTGEVGIRYRRHAENITQAGKTKSHLADRLIAQDILLSQHPDMYRSYKIARSHSFEAHSRRLYLAGDLRDSARFSTYALHEKILNLRAWGVLGLCLAGPVGSTLVRRYREWKKSG
jgi:glycosyltransferase involved in cell wall biosynthesis